jgi:hemerythrin-like metal-binding protein
MKANTGDTQVGLASTLVWSDALLLGYGPMDVSHQEFVAVVSALMDAADEQLGDHLEQVETHLHEHFGTEDRWMEETDFPARECHMNEHAAVLRSLEQVKELWADGNTTIVRQFGDELVRWFPGHADYLDSALSHWMSKARLGGKPVVLRRNLSFEEPAIFVIK